MTAGIRGGISHTDRQAWREKAVWAGRFGVGSQVRVWLFFNNQGGGDLLDLRVGSF